MLTKITTQRLAKKNGKYLSILKQDQDSFACAAIFIIINITDIKKKYKAK